MKTVIRFVCSGYEEYPADLLSRLGIRPNKVWSAGDLRSENSCLKYKEHGFVITLPESDEDLDTRVQSKLDHWRGSGELQARRELFITFYLNGSERPVVFLKPATLLRLGFFDFTLDVEFFYLG